MVLVVDDLSVIKDKVDVGTVTVDRVDDVKLSTAVEGGGDEITVEEGELITVVVNLVVIELDVVKRGVVIDTVVDLVELADDVNPEEETEIVDVDFAVNAVNVGDLMVFAVNLVVIELEVVKRGVVVDIVVDLVVLVVVRVFEVVLLEEVVVDLADEDREPQ
ncbi:hypothetical protein HK098_005968 [Nowakowskiella sp. JEL0407]|nr:hypothetical protein HK098_005968 [Nowakowskiella sp. JEL0407]